MTTFMILYLQLNLLLALSWVVWKAVYQLVRLGHAEPGHQQALSLARALFVSLPLLLLLSYLLDGLVSQALPVAAGALTITPAVTEGLSKNVQVSGKPVTLTGLLMILMIAGLLVGLWRFAGKLRSLQRIARDAVPWKAKGRVSVLISEVAETPFSTAVLGRNIVVLPYSLVQSHDNFHIALKHELQHVRNGDLNWVVMVEVVKLLCYWNPFIYLWQNEFDCLQEFACDEALVNRGRLTTQRYGRCLLEVASTVPEKRLPATSNMVPKFSFWMKAESQLRRRISMLKVKQHKKSDKIRVAASGTLMAGGIMLVSALWLTESSMAQEGEREAEYLPLTTIPPKYPRVALQNNLEGWVVARFTVTEEGKVEEAIAVDSCVLAQEAEWERQERIEECLHEHEGLFDQVSLDAINQFTFEPKGEEVENVEYVFTYRLSEE